MAKPTVKVPNLGGLDVPGLTPDPGTFFFNNETNELQYIDLSANVIALASAGTPIAQQLWVNFANGDDANNGDIDHPYKTYEAARIAAVGVASPTNRYLIHVIGSQTAGLTVSPYVNVDGHSTGTFTGGTVNLDNNWVGITNEKVYVDRCNLPMDIDLSYGGGAGDFVIFRDCNFAGAVNMTVVGVDGVGANADGIIISRNNDTTGTSFTGNIQLYDALSLFQECTIASTINALDFSTGVNSVVILDSCIVNGTLFLDGSGGSGTVAAIVRNTPIPFHLVDTNCLINTDVSSYVSAPILGGGATIAQITLRSSSDGLIVNNFTPSNYTVSVDASRPDNCITDHLEGIDNALSVIAPPVITIDGMAINSSSGINGPLDPITSSYEIKIGNVVIFSVKWTFNAQATDPFVTFSKTYGGAFTDAKQALGAGSVAKSPTATLGDGVVAEVRANGASGVRVNMNVATTTQDYVMEVTGTYEVI